VLQELNFPHFLYSSCKLIINYEFLLRFAYYSTHDKRRLGQLTSDFNFIDREIVLPKLQLLAVTTDADIILAENSQTHPFEARPNR